MIEPCHHYALHGLTLRSALPFPELVAAPSDRSVDVDVRLGATPERLENPRVRGVCFEAAPHEFLISKPGTARFHVRNGCEISIEIAPAADLAEVRRLFLSSPLAALLLMRGLLPVQASAIATPQGAVLLAAGACVGKSTLAMELNRRGFPLLSDDISVIRCAPDAAAMVEPGYPQIKLWPDTLRRFQIEAAHLPRVRPELEKRIYDCAATFEPASRHLHRIYIVQRAAAPPQSQLVHPLRGAERGVALISHLYLSAFMLGLDVQSDLVPRIGNLARTIPIAGAVQPGNRFALRELADAIETDWKT